MNSLFDRRDLIHERAVEATGLHEFGDRDYYDALGVLLQSADEDRLITSVQGQGAFLGNIQRRLEARLQTIAGFKRHPEVLNRKIIAPVFILGLTRSGTTVLQQMLSRDPQFQALHYWLGESPQPRPARSEWPTYPIYRQIQKSIDALYAERPHMKAMHFMAADEPEECRIVLEQTFAYAFFCMYSALPGYRAWLMEQDLRPQYGYYGDVLKLIGANEPGKTWLLKCPHHSVHVEHLLQVFPDARIILTHRNPQDVVASTCSLASTFVSLFEDDNFDPNRLGARLLSELDAQLRSLLQARQRHPANFYDFRFTEFANDPLGSVQKMYRHFGLHYDETLARTLKGWLDQNPKGKHGHYSYDPQDFGLTPEVIRERFSYYEDYRV